ncbi:S-layer homology domain-containing protein [Pontibacillus yanchengensis]|uniref:SLH domain-containing protein n=1 Tax=Pontibacillus yanchengensis Y32 TaxID=1385514 RepID=A0A0A2TJN3_9BACI|nr:S-layer homology domain-containing protein [Pontibacillus yanchengensis]KGP74653.1 hypothetical protein N782_00050 [Pontibacillus yanchengensis Y32]
MAFQPKSYRKFMVASASAALVGSAVAPAVAGAAEMETAAEAFTDVDQDTTHYEHLNALYQDGVIQGFEDGTFKPNDYVPRSEAAEMIFNALNLEEVEDLSSFTFTDVNDRLKGEVQALVNEEVVDGYSETDFGYADHLTREQMAKMLTEAFDVPQQDVPDADFTDLMDTKLYPFINAVAEADIADGYEDGSFGVGDKIKRVDFAKMLHNAMKQWEGGDEAPMLSEVGQVKMTLPNVYVAEIKRDALEGATAETEVTLDVNGETVELMYNEERDSFRNIDISGFEQEELENAKVMYEMDGDGNGDDVTKLGAVTELDGKVKMTLPNVYVVELNLSDLEDVTAEDTVALWINEEEVMLEYDEERDAFRNIEVSGYTQSELENASVVVK